MFSFVPMPHEKRIKSKINYEMPLITTIFFNCFGKKLKAVLSINDCSVDMKFHFEIFDEGLINILTTSHLRFTGSDGYKNIDLYKLADAKEIIDSIMEQMERIKISEQPGLKRRLIREFDK
jgi:hypothetical protein